VKKMTIKKITALFALVLSMGAFSQQGYQMDGPLPATTGFGNGFSPQAGTPPGSFVGQPTGQVGEQPSYVQAGAQNCYDRNYRGPIVGPIQANGQPLPMPGQPGHGY
jgi:hypothetical protein